MKPAKIKYFFLLSVFFLALFAGCGLLKKIISPPKVKLDEISVDKLTLGNVYLLIKLNVKNPNGIDLTITKLNYTLEVNNKKITSGTLDRIVEISAHSESSITVPLKVNYSDIFLSAINIAKKQGIPYHVEGNLMVGSFTLDFNETGHLKFKDL